MTSPKPSDPDLIRPIMKVEMLLSRRLLKTILALLYRVCGKSEPEFKRSIDELRKHDNFIVLNLSLGRKADGQEAESKEAEREI